MKKGIYTISLLVFSLLTTVSFAANDVKTSAQDTSGGKVGAYYGKPRGDVKKNYDKISDLRIKYKDGDEVVVNGRIAEKLKKKRYLFKDSTGSIEIRVDKDIAKTLDGIDSSTNVEVYGEYDKGSTDRIKASKVIILE